MIDSDQWSTFSLLLLFYTIHRHPIADAFPTIYQFHSMSLSLGRSVFYQAQESVRSTVTSINVFRSTSLLVLYHSIQLAHETNDLACSVGRWKPFQLNSSNVVSFKAFGPFTAFIIYYVVEGLLGTISHLNIPLLPLLVVVVFLLDDVVPDDKISFCLLGHASNLISHRIAERALCDFN